MDVVPHVLGMTATPIPRTLALVQHGNMVLSAITEMPPNRKVVTTHVVHGSQPRKRKQMYNAIQRELQQGGRAFIVCTLVKESDSDALAEFKAVEKEFEELKVS